MVDTCCATYASAAEEQDEVNALMDFHTVVCVDKEQ